MNNDVLLPLNHRRLNVFSCQKNETMYSNQMQQPHQSSPMQRPPTMMNSSPMPPHANPAVGVPPMRPMVASSPMQVSMLQQPSQQSMMVRPVGSPYGVVNRAALYDKNKRPPYSNDPRQQAMVPPGQAPPPMPYGNALGPGQPMMPNAIPAGGGAMRQ